MQSNWDSAQERDLLVISPNIPGIESYLSLSSLVCQKEEVFTARPCQGFQECGKEIAISCWSRREDLNTPSADYGSDALALSYTGSFCNRTMQLEALRLH